MHTIVFNDLETLRWAWSRWWWPAPGWKRADLIALLGVAHAVIVGVLWAIALALVYRYSRHADPVREDADGVFLLVFFHHGGVSAKFSALRAGGKPL